MEKNEIITFEEGKRGGQPCIRGMRITVSDVLDYLASYDTVDEILADFPDITREDITAAIDFAAQVIRKSGPMSKFILELDKDSPGYKVIKETLNEIDDKYETKARA